MPADPPDHLERLSAEFHEHWGRILEIQRELYEREVACRRGARECARALREIEQITQPMMRASPPKLEAVKSVPGDW